MKERAFITSHKERKKERKKGRKKQREKREKKGARKKERNKENEEGAFIIFTGKKEIRKRMKQT